MERRAISRIRWSLCYPAQVPVPLRLTTWCPLDALSLIVREPVTEPFTVGLKLTEIAQLFPGGTDPPHVLVWVKPAVVVIPVMLSVALPELLSVTLLLELLVPTACLPKLRLVGLTDAIGVGVAVGVAVAVGAGVGVAVGDGEGVLVGIAVGVGDGDAAGLKEITEAE